jgi:hypothetical protein
VGAGAGGVAAGAGIADDVGAAGAAPAGLLASSGAASAFVENAKQRIEIGPSTEERIESLRFAAFCPPMGARPPYESKQPECHRQRRRADLG